MAYQKRVVGLVTDERCKSTQVKLANCSTLSVIGPKLTRKTTSDPSVFTPDNTKTYVVRCPHPEMPSVGDPTEPIPDYLYASYFASGTPNTGKIYRYAYDHNTQTLGSAELLITLGVNTTCFMMVVDQLNGVIISYESDSGVPNTSLKKYSTAGALLATFETFSGGAVPAGIDIARTSNLLAVTQASATIESVLIYDYDYNLIRVLDSRIAQKMLLPMFSMDETDLTWYHFLDRPLNPLGNLDDWWRGAVNGSPVAAILTENNELVFQSTSGERHVGKVDDRAQHDYIFYTNPPDRWLKRTSYSNPGSVTNLATVNSGGSGGSGMDINRPAERIAYGKVGAIRWIKYDGTDDIEIAATVPNSPTVEALGWGF